MLDHLLFNKLKWWSITDDKGNFNSKLIPVSGTIRAGAPVNGGGTTAPRDVDVTITGFLRAGAELNHQEYAGENLSYDVYTIKREPALNTNSVWIPVTSFKKVNWGGKVLLNTVISRIKSLPRLEVA